MFGCLNSCRTIPLLPAGAMMIFASMCIASGQTDCIRLEADVLARSRGNSQGSSLYQNSCSALNLNTPCSDPTKGAGAFCATCSTTSYPSVLSNGSYGYQQASGSGTVSCGNNLGGKCNATGTNCTPAVPSVVLGACQNGPSVLTQP